jgi:hypothetical protein
MNTKYLHSILFIFIIIFFTSCGGGSSVSSDQNNSSLTQGSGIAYFIDSPVEGLSYIGNDGVSGKTDKNGKFTYNGNTEVKFYIGKAYIGDISSIDIKRDKKVFIQDIVGVDRAKTFDTRVVKIARVLQSLDDDGEPENGITLKKEILREVSIDTLSPSEIASIVQETGKSLIAKKRVKTHLNSVLLRETGLNPFFDTSVDDTPPIKPNITYPTIEQDGYKINNKTYYYFTNNSPQITVNGEIESQVVVNDIPQENTYIDVDDNISVTLKAGSDDVLDDGYYEYNISLKDSSQNISDTTTIVLVKETTPPATPTFASQPPSLTNSNSINVEINTSMQSWELAKGASVWTRSDLKGWTYKTEIQSNGLASFSLDTSDLKNAESKNFYIRLKDNFTKKTDNDRTSGILSFSVLKDTFAPDVPFRIGNNPIITNSNNFTIRLRAEKNAKIFSNNIYVATVPNNCNNSECEVSVTLSFPSNTEGLYSYNLFAQDMAENNSSTLTIMARKDNNIPNPPILNSNNNDLVIYTNDTADIIGDNKERVELKCSPISCQDENLSIYINGSDSGIDLNSSGEYDFNFDLSDDDNTSIYEITFVDNVGRSSLPRVLTLHKDTSSPALPQITSNLPDRNTTTEDNITIIIKAQEIGLDVLIAGVPQNIEINSSYEAELFINIGSIDTTRNYNIFLRDKAQNISSPLTLTMTRDTTPPNAPTVSFIDPSNQIATNKNSIILRVTGEIGTNILIGGHKLNPNVVIGQMGYADITLDTTGADGGYSFDISLSDVVNNVSATITKSILKDTIPPSSPFILTSPMITHTNKDSTTILISGESGGSIWINGIDSGLLIEPTNQKILNLDTSGEDGDKTFEIRLKDDALNTSGKLSFTIIKDTVAPSRLSFTDIENIPTHTLDDLVSNIEVRADFSEAENKIFINNIDTGISLNLAGKAIISLDTSGNTLNSRQFNIVQQDKAGNNSAPLELSIFKDDNYLYIKSAIFNLVDNSMSIYFSDNVSSDSFDNILNPNNDFNLSSVSETLGSIDVQEYINRTTEINYNGFAKFKTSNIMPYYAPNYKPYGETNKDNYLINWNKINVKYTISSDRRVSGEVEDQDNIPPPYYATIGTQENNDFEIIRGYEPFNIELFMPIVKSGQTISYENTPNIGNPPWAPIDHNITYNRDDGACSTSYGFCSNTIVDKGCTKIDNGGEPTVKCTGTHLEWQDNDPKVAGTVSYAVASSTDTTINGNCSKTYAGKNDWRLPTINELITISDKGDVNPSIDDAFTDYSLGSAYFWSNDRYSAETPIKRWVYGIYKGNTYYYLETDNEHVYTRCVRGIDLSIK